MGVKLSTMLGIAACKASRTALRVAKSGGTAFPGKAAMFFDKDILEKVSEDMEIIVVTGTNGKTTTCRMLEQAFADSGKDVIANRSGSNLLRGITADLVANADLQGRAKKKYAVLECDEGALKQVVPRVKPKVILVTNLFRDQLDRYGDVTGILKHIKKGIKKAPDSVICLNADCSLSSALAWKLPNEVRYFGIDVPVGENETIDLTDAKNCLNCGEEYKYHYHTYAHLGGFYCPKCGYKRQDPNIAVTAIKKLSPKGSEVSMSVGGEEREIFISIPAVYNVYNAAGALCAYEAAGHDKEEMIASLAKTRSSFGRMENFDLGGVPVQMILVKNTAGCNQAISYFTQQEEKYNAVICLNNHIADGQDISWIWEVDYEKMIADEKLGMIYVSGERAQEMKERLLKAGAGEEQIKVIEDWGELVESMKESELPIFAIPNYSAMMSLRAELAKATGKSGFWEG